MTFKHLGLKGDNNKDGASWLQSPEQWHFDGGGDVVTTLGELSATFPDISISTLASRASSRSTERWTFPMSGEFTDWWIQVFLFEHWRGELCTTWDCEEWKDKNYKDVVWYVSVKASPGDDRTDALGADALLKTIHEWWSVRPHPCALERGPRKSSGLIVILWQEVKMFYCLANTLNMSCMHDFFRSSCATELFHFMGAVSADTTILMFTPWPDYMWAERKHHSSDFFFFFFTYHKNTYCSQSTCMK